MFQPVIPTGGFAGWKFLERTMDGQQTAFSESAAAVRTTDYFKENIGKITTAKDLVADRQLLSVALGAFGLDDDIDNKFFIQKILEDGTTSNDALSSRLADKSYAAFSAAFGFGDPVGAKTGLTGFADKIIDKYNTKQFQVAVGEQDANLRLALGLQDSLDEIITRNSSANAQWFAMMGTPPVRKVFETALGLPSSLAQIDLDQQLTTFQDRARSVFGVEKMSDFSDPDKKTDLLRMFLVRAEANSITAVSSGNIALSLLRA